jgi:hypothetical protein
VTDRFVFANNDDEFSRRFVQKKNAHNRPTTPVKVGHSPLILSMGSFAVASAVVELICFPFFSCDDHA